MTPRAAEGPAATADASADDARLREFIAAERRDLADQLRLLAPQDWDAPTLCSGWRVRDLVAHMTMPFRYSKARFAAELARSGGRFNRMSDRCAKRDGGALGPAELAEALGGNAEHSWRPPGGGYQGALIHDVIHGMDFTVPLGGTRRVPLDRLRIVLAGISMPRPLAYFGTDLIGVRLVADDMDWSFGAGAPVAGPAQDLALVLCGRRLPPGRLTGDLSGRFTASG